MPGLKIQYQSVRQTFKPAGSGFHARWDRSGSWQLGRHRIALGTWAYNPATVTFNSRSKHRRGPGPKQTRTAFGRLAITPDGGLIVVERLNSSIELVSLRNGEVVKTLKKQDSILRLNIALAISPDGKLLASPGRDNHIDLWSLPDGALQQTLVGHSKRVNALAISPDGTLLASGSDDKTIRLWSLPQGKQLLCLLDLKANYKTTKGVQYKSVNQYGQTITYTLPCGSPIPAGAVCICNCVLGSLTMPANHTQSFSSTGVCTCDLICTCNTVCTCQAVGSPGGYPGGYGGHYWYPN